MASRVVNPSDELARPQAALERLLYFDGSEMRFCQLLLANQAEAAGASEAAIFIVRRPMDAAALCAHPPIPPGAPDMPAAEPPAWLQSAIRAVMEKGFSSEPRLLPEAGDGASARLVLFPLMDTESVERYACFRIPPHPAIQPASPSAPCPGIRPTADATARGATASFSDCLRRLALTPVLWRHYQVHARNLAGNAEAAGVLSPALEVLSAAHASNHFAQSSLALVNELATRFRADRVSLGFLDGAYVRLAALSHAEKFGRKMDLAQSIEDAMEECLDQDMEIVIPAEASTPQIARAARELCRRHASGAAVIMPLRYESKPTAAVAIEWAEERPPASHDLRMLRLVCDLAAPRLVELRRRDRGLAARAADACRRGLAWAVGSRHTWAKAAALAASAALAFMFLASGPWRVDAAMVALPSEQRVVAAPFDGFLAEAPMAPAWLLSGDIHCWPDWRMANCAPAWRPGRRSARATSGKPRSPGATTGRPKPLSRRPAPSRPPPTCGCCPAAWKRRACWRPWMAW